MKQPARWFSHLYLDNWRNFTRVEADLERRVLLVGPNASGKSNLLDALRFLGDLVAPGGGFQEAIRRRGGVSRLRCLAAQPNSEVAIAVRIAGEDGPDWEYAIEFSHEDHRKPSLLRERVACGGNELLNRPDEQDLADPERLTQTLLEQAAANREFREIADFLATVRHVHPVPQIIREPGWQSDSYCGGLIAQIASASESTRDSRLRRILHTLRDAVPQLQRLELWKDARGTPHLRARHGQWRPQGAWHTEDQISDGTLRLIAILWAALDGAGPLLVEEPELSLHPEVIRGLLPMFEGIQRRSGRQLFISTHSADLVEDERLPLEDVLLLVPGEEETSVRPPAAHKDLRALLDGTLTEAVPPTPFDEDQLELFGADEVEAIAERGM
jgi:predicted ATPase